jgi:Ca2+-dependent lipid-binding protein
VRLTIHQAKELDYTKSMSGDLNPFARVFLGDSHKPVHTTPQFKHTNNPIWESPKEFLCPDKASSVISVKVVDDRSFLNDPIVGERALRLTDLLEAKKNGLDWFPLDNCKSGKIRISAEWKPLDMAGSLQGADQYIPPIGIVRLW